MRIPSLTPLSRWFRNSQSTQRKTDKCCRSNSIRDFNVLIWNKTVCNFTRSSTLENQTKFSPKTIQLSSLQPCAMHLSRHAISPAPVVSKFHAKCLNNASNEVPIVWDSMNLLYVAHCTRADCAQRKSFGSMSKRNTFCMHVACVLRPWAVLLHIWCDEKLHHQYIYLNKFPKLGDNEYNCGAKVVCLCVGGRTELQRMHEKNTQFSNTLLCVEWPRQTHIIHSYTRIWSDQIQSVDDRMRPQNYVYLAHSPNQLDKWFHNKFSNKMKMSNLAKIQFNTSKLRCWLLCVEVENELHIQHIIQHELHE